jgi:hypothetical protein
VIDPFVHGFPVPHPIPALHATQRPLPSQTPPLHGDPALRCVVALQTGDPVEQSIAPSSHSFIGAHDAPGVHATHVPRPSHTPDAHAVPAATFEATMHCAVPPPHS